MELFSTLKGLKQAKRILSSAVESNRLAHAYILAGPNGSGRLTAALDLAKSRICPEVENGFCGECRHCRQIDNFTHPDVRITIPGMKSTGPEEFADLLRSRAGDGITPLRLSGNTYISIAQMRELAHRLSRKSFEGYGYVEIVYDAHRLKKEAANAILKTLEEPPEKTLIILITSRVSGLLPTVRSRAHTVRFGRLTADMVEELLVERTGITSQEAAEIALVSNGCAGLALTLSTEGVESSKMAGDVFNLIFNGSFGDMELAVEIEKLSRKLGREGMLSLCTEMVLLIHDQRRVLSGARPLAHKTVPVVNGVGDQVFQQMEVLFRRCEAQLKANVSPSMAFSAAVVGSRVAEYRDER